MLSRLANVPLFSRLPMQGSVSGRHTSPHRGRASSSPSIANTFPATISAGSTGASTADRTAFTSRNSRLIPTYAAASSSTPVDRWAFGSKARPRSNTLGKLAGSLGYLAVQQGDAVGVSCVAARDRPESAADSEPRSLAAFFDVLEQANPSGETHLPEVLHELAETIRQRALIVILSDLFIEPELLRGCFQHLLFRKHDVAVFHLLDAREISFDFTPADALSGYGRRPRHLRRAQRHLGTLP